MCGIFFFKLKHSYIIIIIQIDGLLKSCYPQRWVLFFNLETGTVDMGGAEAVRRYVMSKSKCRGCWNSVNLKG